MPSLSSPRESTLKRLFALSSNRCAFPKCQVLLFDGSTFAARVCHIKGSKPTAPRHDPTQCDEERHGFENLLLLCPNHHAVIDDDEVAYTVQRLLSMKAAHEEKAIQITDDEIERAILRLTAESISLRSVNTTHQSRGIAANTVNITINGPAVAKTNEAVDLLWKTMLRAESQFADVVLVEMIMVPREIDDKFHNDAWTGNFESINDLRSETTVMHRMREAGLMNADEVRIHVPSSVWDAFGVFRAILGRVAILYNLSFSKRAYVDWRSDPLFDNSVSAALGAAVLNQARGLPLGGVQFLLDATKERFRSGIEVH